MSNQKVRCSRGDECKSYKAVGCRGCGFQHFDRIDDTESDLLVFLKNRYFQLCSENRKGPGGRIALDLPFKELVLKEAKKYIEDFPELKELTDLNDKVCVGNNQYNYRIKCDSSFKFNQKYIFVEIKGSGDDTNSILSAITAAQLVSSGIGFTSSRYYYLGCMSTLSDNGLKREDFLNEKRTKISPYVRWAENKEFIEFYGIRDIELMLRAIRDYCVTA